MAQDSTSKREAVSYLASAFFAALSQDGVTLEEAEDACIAIGHAAMAEAYAGALERLDAALCSSLPEGTRVHDRRERTLATKVGDVTFRYRRCRDAAGNTVVPLADALDVPWGSRISPAAASFLVGAGAQVSYARSAALLESAGGSRVSAVAVMGRLHGIGELCAEEDAAAADSLFGDGVVPEAETEAAEICLEGDGTWFRLQRVPEGEPRLVEVKALVAYAGKEVRGGKTRRSRPVRHGCVGSPAGFWREGVAAVGTRFDLSKVRKCHLGCDGEAMYGAGGAFLPCETDRHVDPFHVNRAVLSCLGAENRELAVQVLNVAMDGDAAAAAALLDVCAENGIGGEAVPRVAAFLRNNAADIYGGGPSLGTMEAEQQHVYGCRMDSVPCAWSRAGADAMARIRSRVCSGRALPRPTRAGSVTPKRRRRSEARELAFYGAATGARVPESSGRGKEAEHSASLVDAPAAVRYAAGVDTGMVAM